MQPIPTTPEILGQLATPLGRSPLFRGLDASVLQGAASQAALVQAAAGEFLTKEGEAPDAFFLLLEGHAVTLNRRRSPSTPMTRASRARKEHVLTLEDPVEFVHPNRLALVNQREIGSNTESFARALRAALREDPDIVLATLHASTAASTIDRIVGMFPAEEQAQIRSTLADVLRGVICQDLCRKIGGGRVAALEIMVVNPAVSNLIREGKTVQIPSIMQAGKADLAKRVDQ